MKIIAAGEWNIKQLEALGASGLSVAWPDAYQIIDRGVADGITPQLNGLIGFRFAELVKYLTNMPLWFPTFYTVMNWDTWKSLSPDVQKVFTDVCGEYGIDKWDSFHISYEQEAKDLSISKYGMKVLELTSDEKSKWNERVMPVRNEYVKRLDAAKLPGKKLLEEYDRLLKKWAAEPNPK